MNAPAVNRARAYYVSKNLGADCPEALTDFEGKFGAGEFLHATLTNDSTEHFVGSFNAEIVPIGNNRVQITLTNVTSRESACIAYQ